MHALQYSSRESLHFASPRSAIATGQNLYHRFHLFFPIKDFNYHVRTMPPSIHPFTNEGFPQDVALATLYVSTKMHDTLKKPREILMASYSVRFPELAAKLQAGGGEVDMDPNVSKLNMLKNIPSL
jgi:CTD kinase subunit beta